MMRQFIVVCLLLALFIPIVQATTVVVNSDDWMDVYSGLQFAFLKGDNARFLTSKRYAPLLMKIIPKSDDVLVIESQKVPFTVNLASLLEKNGYSAETIYVGGGRATNIELAKLSGATRFVVVDPSYGYNAISVIPYAQATNAYVLFADRKNIEQVLAFLKSTKLDYLLLYGQLDTDLVDRLAVLGAEVINKGNRYKDNIEIMKKQLAANPASQLLLTDGSIIEEQLMRAGKSGMAILLIGRDAVPQDVISFVKTNNFRTGVLIGNHLTQSAKRLKDATGLPIFIKFGMGITQGTTAEPVRALDMFFLPTINLELLLRGINYNPITKKVEITYQNKGIRAFARTSIGVLADGERVLTVGDQDVQRIESNEVAAFDYDADLTSYVAGKQNLTVDLFTLYGESPETLDRAVALATPLPVEGVQDKCDLAIRKVSYNAETQRFVVSIDNTGPVDCYAMVELKGVIVNDLPTDIPAPEKVRVQEGESANVYIKQRLTSVDLADNPQVFVQVQFGERQDFLLSSVSARLPLEEFAVKTSSTTIILAGIIALLVIIIIAMWFLLRKEKKGKKPKTRDEEEDENGRSSDEGLVAESGEQAMVSRAEGKVKPARRSRLK